MAHSKSARKRIRQNITCRERNKARKTRIKNACKAVLEAIKEKDLGKAEQMLKEASRTLDRVASTGIIHKNMAARKKSRLAAKVSQLRTKVE